MSDRCHGWKARDQVPFRRLRFQSRSWSPECEREGMARDEVGEGAGSAVASPCDKLKSQGRLPWAKHFQRRSPMINHICSSESLLSSRVGNGLSLIFPGVCFVTDVAQIFNWFSGLPCNLCSRRSVCKPQLCRIVSARRSVTSWWGMNEMKQASADYGSQPSVSCLLL